MLAVPVTSSADIAFFDLPSSLKTNMRQVDIKHSQTAFSIDNDMGLLEDFRGLHNTSENIAIDDMKSHSSCSTCGVSWNEDHVSLDCFECGGYSMERPCPICDGQCKEVWRRDITMSHSMRKAHWEGKCGLPVNEQQPYFLKNLIDINEDSLSEALEELNTSS